MSEPIRVAICDDHPVVRYGLAKVFNREPDLESVLEAASAEQLLRSYAGLAPDVLILDLELNGLSGVDCLRELRQIDATAKVIIYSAHDDSGRVTQTVDLGVKGYHLKSADCSELIKGVRTVYQGGMSFDADILGKLFSKPGQEAKTELSSRETQVLELLAVGKSNNDIANCLYICERTVKYHVSSILNKLQLSNRTEAAIYARQNNIYPLESR